jgi:hypothetical protein
MNKFNGYERQLIRDALVNHAVALENEVKETEGRSIFAEGFFEMTISELLGKVDKMTLKKHLK